MADGLYDLARAAFANGGINWLTDTIKVVMLTSSYTPNLATHQFLSDVGATTLGTAQTLGTKTNTAGVLDAADPTFTAVTGTGTYILFYKDTGTSTTSPLIGLIDGKKVTASATLANTGATTVFVDALPCAIPIGNTVVFGAVTATLTAAAAVGDRSITVSALSGAVAQGTSGIATYASGLPIVSSGGNVAITFDNGTNKIFKL